MFLAGMVGLLPFAQAVSWYQITDIGILPNTTSSSAQGLNEHGDVVGYTLDANGAYTAFVYTQGALSKVETLAGSQSLAFGINNNRQIVGQYQNALGEWRPFLSANEIATDIGLSGNTDGNAYAINNQGGVAITAKTPAGFTHAYSYQAGITTDLGTLGGNISGSMGLNDAGEIVGGAWLTYANHAFKYSQGQMADLGSTRTHSDAFAINESGIAVGQSYYNDSSNCIAVMFKNNEIYELGTLPGIQCSLANDINNRDQIVGISYYHPLDQMEAVLYENGEMYNLNNLIDPASGWHLKTAAAINDNGQIVGYGLNASGQPHAFLLTPVPEPATAALLLLGAVGIVGRVGGRRSR